MLSSVNFIYYIINLIGEMARKNSTNPKIIIINFVNCKNAS